MTDERRDKVRDHDYDGIQEFDNQLPRWWIGTFAVTVLFGLYYWTAHHTFDALPGQHGRFVAESQEIADTQAAHGVGGAVTDAQELAVFHDPAQVAAGKKLFGERCAVCHGAAAQGVIGPNLTDDYWLHGGRPSQIVATITNGVPDKGMVTWKGVLSGDEIKRAAAYVISIHGSKPAGAKAPQGALEAWTVKYMLPEGLETLHQRRSSIDSDGRRRKVRLGDVAGPFTTWRRRAFAALIAVYAALPFLRAHGNPVILLDILHRRFYLFGDTFNAQDATLLFFLLVGGILGLFLVTALFGRVWCGWACPQTVFLEGVFRPVERWLEGNKDHQLRLAAKPWMGRRLGLALAKHGLYLAVALGLAHVFLSYFVGVDQLRVWIFGDPASHPTAFAWMACVSAALYGNFAWFREQTCVILCPYGRIQSALTDEDTLVIGYDSLRGEPRGHRKSGDALPKGDCVDCRRCVDVCPTAIDIREGLQLECIGCANCADACDDIMARLGRPLGLVRYDSLRGLSGLPRRLWRPRLWIYLAVLCLIGAIGVDFAAARRPFEATLMRQQGPPFQRDGLLLRNTYLLHLVNKTPDPAGFSIELLLPPTATGLVPLPRVTLPSLGDLRVPVDVSVPQRGWSGEFEVVARTTDLATGRMVLSSSRFLGPN